MSLEESDEAIWDGSYERYGKTILVNYLNDYNALYDYIGWVSI